MIHRSTTFPIGVALLAAGLMVPVGNPQQIAKPVKAIQLTGLVGVKNDAKGTLSVDNGNLHFMHGKETSDLSVTSIEDVVTGADSRKSVGNTVGLISMAAPYGGGRFLSLFRTKIDTLTVQYRDPDGGLHGAIFTMPVGTADVIKKDLVAQGAHTSAIEEQDVLSTSPNNSSTKEQKQ
jgi:hypothetical protein